LVIDSFSLFMGDLNWMRDLKIRLEEIFRFKRLKELFNKIIFISPEKATKQMLKNRLNE
jgi:hypothetical protein